jgi:hypothetical protein
LSSIKKGIRAMRNLMKGLVLALIMALGFAAPAFANIPPPGSIESLPTSTAAAAGTWKVMHPSTFAGTTASAVAQCQRDAVLSETDLITPEKCAKVAAMLATGQYRVVMNGRGSVARNVVKGTGREDRALLLDLGDGVYMYWYTGVKNQSCNNVGFTIVVPPPIAMVVPPAPKKSSCHYVTITSQSRSSEGAFISALLLQGCSPQLIQSLWLQASPIDNTTTNTLVCN